jgi:L-cystine uptake protein TcyP (sodium:dicarboxylate symporter family)
LSSAGTARNIAGWSYPGLPMSAHVILNLAVFAGLLGLLARFGRREARLSRRILAGLGAGALYGFALQLLYAGNAEAIAATLAWTDVVGSGYVNLLRLVITPLVLVMMVAAVVRMGTVGALGRIGLTVVGLLVGTTMIAALIGIGVANAFGLTAEGLTVGARELARTEALSAKYQAFAELAVPDLLIALVPANVFADLTEARPTSIIGVVVFGILAGIAALGVAREQPAREASILAFVETAQAVVLKLVHIVMALTPFGILALITRVVAGSDAGDILELFGFVAASYLAILAMFAVHALLLLLGGVRVVDYFRQVWPVLAFAFTSRSSAATIPLNVETQVEALGVRPPVANLAASFGATIGQNGCAGIYPAMLAVMTAPGMGVDPAAPAFVAGLVAIVAIASFGVAGVGGGATFAAFIVLPMLGFPVAVAALLISVEPLIDMGRTALNVNGSMTAGVLADRLLGRSLEPPS